MMISKNTVRVAARVTLDIVPHTPRRAAPAARTGGGARRVFAVFRRDAEDCFASWFVAEDKPEALLQQGDVTLDRIPMDGLVSRPVLARRGVSELPIVLDDKVEGLLLSRDCTQVLTTALLTRLKACF